MDEVFKMIVEHRKRLLPLYVSDACWK